MGFAEAVMRVYEPKMSKKIEKKADQDAILPRGVYTKHVMEISSLFFGRIQFELTVALFYAFMGFSVGLAFLLTEGFSFKRDHLQHFNSETFRVWLRVFALALFSTFALGFLTIIEMGLIWPVMIGRMGNAFGPLMLCAVVVFVVLKSTALDVMLFGKQRASVAQYRWAMWLVLMGLCLVAYFVIVFDSWSRQPAGTMLIDGRNQIYDWVALFLQPNAMIQSVEFLLESIYASVCLLLGFAAWQSKVRPLQSDQTVHLNRALIWGLFTLGLHVVLIFFLNQNGNMPEKFESQFIVFRIWLGFCIALGLWLVAACLSLKFSGQLKFRLIFILAIPIGMAVSVLAWLTTNEFRGDFAMMNVAKSAQYITTTPTAWLALGLSLLFMLFALIIYGFVRLSCQAMTQGVVPVVKVGVKS
jgi:cytochrome bd-type quinol oxidase subunit 1